MSADRADHLRIRGARAGNLRELDLELPLGAWTAVHGPSGAGKSALLFGVLAPVARRRFRVLADPAALPESELGWLERVADEVAHLPPVVASAGEVPRGRRGVRLGDAWRAWELLDRTWRAHGECRCPACGHAWRPWTPQTVAAEPWSEGAVLHVFRVGGGEERDALLAAGWTRWRRAEASALERLEEAPDVLPDDALLLLDRMRFRDERRERLAEALAEGQRSGRALRLECDGAPRVLPGTTRCPACAAALPPPPAQPGPEAPGRVLAGRPWNAWAAAPLRDWLDLPLERADPAARRLDLLERCGLGHLAPNRTLGSLSLGEARRVELVSWLAVVRRGQLLLLDEPGMGLHGHERLLLAELLHELVARGNTVLTADPAREFLEAAHGWLALGPGGGEAGGRIVAHGGPDELPPEPLPPARDAPVVDRPTLVFRDLRARHLAIPELALPLRSVVAVCGVSGSGKSTLLEDELVPRLRDGRPGRDFVGALPEGGVGVLLERKLGHAAVSTVATLSGAWSELRALFAEGEEARMRGLAAADLGLRPGAGACEACRGRGATPEDLPCPTCDGLGLRPDLLELRRRGRSLRWWLTRPLEDLRVHLPPRSRLARILERLVALGLGPRRLGERGRHLSLGERGRIALARALATARADRPRLFLLDEPCLGLPHSEARRVVDLLHRLVAEEGHSFWVVEHHELFLREADHLIELGPGAGEAGGRLLHAGPPAALDGADTPTARWWRARSAPPPAPPPRSAPEPPRSAVLTGGLDASDRRALEALLRRELVSRSPLEADLADVGAPAGGPNETDAAPARALEGGGAAPAAVPCAWPVTPGPRRSLGAVLGLDSLREPLRRRAAPRCPRCGGAGPWPGLEEAAAAHPPGPHLFVLEPPAAFVAREEHGRLLLAAGLRRTLRPNGDGFVERRAGRGETPQLVAGERIVLDRFAADEPDAPGRLRDLLHALESFGAAALEARAPEPPFAPRWTFHPGRCRDCGAEVAARPHLGPLDLERLGDARLGAVLTTVAREAPELEGPRRLAALLADTALLERRLGTPLGRLTAPEARLARLAGLLAFPVPGVLLLADAPLAGLPAGVARRLGTAMLDDDAGGAFLFTDPEGFVRPPDAGATPEVEAEPRPRPMALGFDPDAFAEPPRAAEAMRLREALGLEEALRRHFLRTDEARVLGLGPDDLDRRRSPLRCARCGGAGEEPLHPATGIACPACGGSGFGPRTARLEDRGLSWNALGRRTVAELAVHFRDTPRLHAVLAEAAALGLGPLALDAPLGRLPLGVRSLAPLAARAAALGEGGARADDVLRVALAAAGLTPFQAAALVPRMAGFRGLVADLEWSETHPALLPSP